MSSDHDKLLSLLASTVENLDLDPAEAKRQIDELAAGRTDKAHRWHQQFVRHDPQAMALWHGLKLVCALDEIKREIRQLAAQLFPDLRDTDQLEMIMQRAASATRTNGVETNA